MVEPVTMFGIEVVLIIGVLILLFGASRIPKVANAIGQATGAFKQGKEESEKEVKKVRDEIERDLKGDTESAEEEIEKN